MPSEEELIKEILGKVVELQKRKTSAERFIPGKTVVNYGGRVYDQEEVSALVESSLEFWLTAGRNAKAFEEVFPRLLGVKHCLLTNSGSSANLLAVSALTSRKLKEKRLVPGDEVITTACGFPTTLNPILQNNLTPVFIDIELGTYNIKTDQISNAVTDKTKAVFIPHTLGNPANLKMIMEAVEEHDLWFIEDNCDALGSKYSGKHTGSFGHISTCSFYPAHHITMGEGGAVLTDDQTLRRIIASFRDWGRDCWCEPGSDNSCRKRFTTKIGKLPYGYDHKYTYSEIGYNLKATDMQAAIGLAQLKKLPLFIKKRKENFDALYSALRGFEKDLLLPSAENGSEPSWFGFPILVRDDAGFSRADIVKHLEDNKVMTRMLFGGNLIKQPAYEGIGFRCPSPLENTDKVMEKLFWVGVYPGIDHERLDYMIDVFKGFFDLQKR